MIDYLYQIINETTINLPTTALRLLLSLIIGLIIGAERQLRRRDAGLRTFSLICAGSTGAMLISIWIPQTYPDFLNGDPGRIAAQVLTGIGFLGAGAIMRGKGSVQGLTTAACIWQTSVIGLAIGAGLYGCAILATILTIFLLVSVEKLERKLFIDGTNRMLIVKCSTSSPNFDELKQTLIEAGILVSSYTFSVDFTKNESVITYKVTVKTQMPQNAICEQLSKNHYVTYINMIA